MNHNWILLLVASSDDGYSFTHPHPKAILQEVKLSTNQFPLQPARLAVCTSLLAETVQRGAVP